jgi:hypothetical protein
MLKRFWVVFLTTLVLAQPAMAGGLNVVPSLDSIPIAISLFPNQPEAASKAQKAFVMQTGIEANYNKVRDYANGQINKVGDKAAKTAQKFVDEETPLDSKTIVFAGAAVYTIAVTKSYTQNLGTPLFNGVHQTLTLGYDRIQTGITYSF